MTNTFQKITAIFLAAIVIVVRYFGGILLGKGGLIRAYGKAAGLALESMQRKG